MHLRRPQAAAGGRRLPRSGWMALVALALVATGPATAGAKGRRNTAAALGAAAAFEAVRGKGPTPDLGAGAVGAYGRYRDARQEERYDDRYRRYDDYRYRSRDDRYYSSRGPPLPGAEPLRWIWLPRKIPGCRRPLP